MMIGEPPTETVLPTDCTIQNTILVLIEPIIGLQEQYSRKKAIGMINELTPIFDTGLDGIYSSHLSSLRNLDMQLKLSEKDVFVDRLNIKNDTSALENALSSNHNVQYLIIYGGFIAACLYNFFKKYRKIILKHNLSPTFLLKYAGTRHPKNFLKNLMTVASERLLKTDKVKFYLSNATIKDLLKWSKQK